MSDSVQKEATKAEQSPREAAEGKKSHEGKAAPSKAEALKQPSAVPQKKPKGGEAKKSVKARPRKAETAKGATKTAKSPKKSSKKKAAAQ